MRLNFDCFNMILKECVDLITVSCGEEWDSSSPTCLYIAGVDVRTLLNRIRRLKRGLSNQETRDILYAINVLAGSGYVKIKKRVADTEDRKNIMDWEILDITLEGHKYLQSLDNPATIKTIDR